MTHFSAWIQAARPAALPMLLLPLVLGQVFALRVHGDFSAVFLLYAVLFGVCFQVYLLYMNDHADRALDIQNTQYWLSGGSRVLPEGKLRPRDLLFGARTALVLLLVLTAFIMLAGDRPWLCVGTLLAVLVSWAYHRKPLRLSYRGRGEVLQGAGCGVLLPLIGFYLQQGALAGMPWLALVPLLLVFYASNIVTALPDFASDQAGGKRTLPVRVGQQKARVRVLLILALTYAIVPLVSPAIHQPLLWAAVVLPPAVILVGVMRSGLHARADVDDFPACKAFVAWVTISQAWLLCAWCGVLLLGGPR